MSTIGLIGALTTPGVATAISFCTARGYDGVFQAGSKIRVKAYSFGGLALILVGFWYWFVELNLSLALVFWVAGPLLPWSHAIDTADPYLVGRSEFRLAFWRRTGAVVLTSVAGVLAAFAAPVAWLVMLSRLIAASAGNTLVYVRIRSICRNNLIDPEFPAKAKSFNYLSRLMSAGRVSDGLVLGAFGVFSDLAALALAQALVSPLEIVAKSCTKLAFSRSSGTLDWRGRVTVSILSAAALAGVILLLLCLIWAIAPLITAAFPKYPELLVYSHVLSLVHALGLANSFALNYALFQHHKIWSSYHIVRGWVRIAGSVAVVTMFGVYGALAITVGFAVLDYLFFQILLLRSSE